MDRSNYVTRTRNQVVPTKNYNKLLSLSLKRIFYHRMTAVFKSLHTNSAEFTKKMNRVQKIASINNEICLAVAWRKIKSYALLNKHEQKIFKNAFVLARRMEMQWLRQSFCQIRHHAQISASASYRKMDNLKKVMICQILKKLYVNTKKNGFTKLKQHMILTKLKKRVLVINTVFRGAQKRSLLYAWTKILNSTIIKKEKQKEYQLEDLQVQLQDMKIQVENKTESINRLQDQLFELRQNSVIKQNENSSFMFNNSFGNKSATQLNRSRSKYQDSNDGSIIRDGSYGSLLGVSVLSYRSRGSNNVSNRQDNCACNICGYRQKYEKYKATNQTLKKQLQIIKTQLDFTKDMNEHMQNEIKALFTNEDKEKKIEKMRNELKESQKDRQMLREKVIKYEKYIAKLKVEFKTKIEEIYRRVKRNG